VRPKQHVSGARWRAAGALMVALSFAAGCSSSGDAGTAEKVADEASEVLAKAKEKGSPEQVEILADGKVTGDGCVCLLPTVNKLAPRKGVPRSGSR
jgi:hypothetical protein